MDKQDWQWLISLLVAIWLGHKKQAPNQKEKPTKRRKPKRKR